VCLDVVCEMEPSIPLLISLHWATLRWPARCNPFLVEHINNYICISQDEFIPPSVYDEDDIVTYYLIITRSKARANVLVIHTIRNRFADLFSREYGKRSTK
jgi:hypothetical protein